MTKRKVVAGLSQILFAAFTFFLGDPYLLLVGSLFILASGVFQNETHVGGCRNSDCK